MLHVGDIHSGKQYCTEAYDRQVFDLWKAFKDPLIYTPGDNEWADCHKVAEGGGAYNAATGADRLRARRQRQPGRLRERRSGREPRPRPLDLLLAEPGHTLGGQQEAGASQAQSFDRGHPTDATVRRERDVGAVDSVLFVTINVPGGSNNDLDIWYGAPAETAAQTQELAERTGADLRWLDAAFAQRQADRVKGVVIMAQADMWDPEKGAAHQAGYEPFVASVAAQTTAFGKPVLMLNGDSHVYRSDNPLSATDPLNLHAPGLQRPELPPHRGPRQHLAARVAAPDDRSREERGQRRERLRPVRVAGRAPVIGRRFAAAHALRAWRDLV